MFSKIKYLMPPLLWAAFIFLVSLIPQHSFPEVNVLNADKAVHCVIYFVLTGSFWSFFYMTGKRQKKAFFLLCVACAFFGFIIEVLQPILTTSRQFDWYDVFANTLGVLLFAVARNAAEKFFRNCF